MNAKELLKKHNACSEAMEWVADRTIAEAWNACERGDWMLWIAAKILDRKLVVRAACAVARTSLKYVPGDELREPPPTTPTTPRVKSLCVIQPISFGPSLLRE